MQYQDSQRNEYSREPQQLPSQKKIHSSLASTLESQKAFHLSHLTDYSVLPGSLIQVVGNYTDPPWLANRKPRTMQLANTTWAKELRPK